MLSVRLEPESPDCKSGGPPVQKLRKLIRKLHTNSDTRRMGFLADFTRGVGA